MLHEKGTTPREPENPEEDNSIHYNIREDVVGRGAFIFIFMLY